MKIDIILEMYYVQCMHNILDIVIFLLDIRIQAIVYDREHILIWWEDML